MVTSSLGDILLARPEVATAPLARELALIMTQETGLSSAGFPYLQRPAWERFRDWVPHLLSHGPRVLDAVESLEAIVARGAEVSSEDQENFARATRVVRQVINTTAVTAPSDLWLLRHVLAAMVELGVVARWLDGESVTLESIPGRPEEIQIDLSFLLSRGLLVRTGAGYRAAKHPTIQAIFEHAAPLEPWVPADLASPWATAFQGGALDPALEAHLEPWLRALPEALPPRPPSWRAGPREIALGYRLVPMIIGLSMADGIAPSLACGAFDASILCPGRPSLSKATVDVLHAAGLCETTGQLNAVGRRVLQRGPGPFGIIEAYRQYARSLERILREGRGVGPPPLAAPRL